MCHYTKHWSSTLEIWRPKWQLHDTPLAKSKRRYEVTNFLSEIELVNKPVNKHVPIIPIICSSTLEFWRVKNKDSRLTSSGKLVTSNPFTPIESGHVVLSLESCTAVKSWRATIQMRAVGGSKF